MALEQFEDRTCPSLDFGWAFGLGSGVSGVGIATHTDGNVYVSGDFSGTVDFDPGPGTFNLTSAGGSDAFVAKYSPTGSLVWATRLGGPDGENSTKVAVDGSNNVYVGIHHFWGNPVSTEVNVTKLNGADGSVLWTTIANNGSFSDIGVAPTGQVYVTGQLNLSHTYVTQLDAAGAVQWTRATSGTTGDYASAVAADSSGNVYVAGNYSGTVDFDPGPATYSLTNTPPPASYHGTVSDAFVWKLDSAGAFIWAKSMGSNGNDGGRAIALDGTGSVYVAGNWGASSSPKKNDFDPGPGVFQLTNQGGFDVFVVKLTGDGNFLWARSMGGRYSDYAGDSGVTVDSTGNVYTTGMFYDTVDFDPGSGKFNLTSAGGFDIFVSKLSSSGSFAAAARMGGAGDDRGAAIAVDGFSNVYTTGGSGGTADFDPGPGTFNLTGGGMFVSKLTQSSPLLAAVSPYAKASTQLLNPTQVQPLLTEALARWEAAGFDMSELSEIEVRIADLPGAMVGMVSGNTIWLDDNAAGWAWFVDSTPNDDSEFTTDGDQGEQGRIDLLTVLMHEIGHLLGQDHEADGVMGETLATGTRSLISSHTDPTDALASLYSIDVSSTDAWRGARSKLNR